MARYAHVLDRRSSAGGTGPRDPVRPYVPLPPLAPAAPANFSMRAGDRRALMEWDDPEDSRVTHHEYSTDGITWTLAPNPNPNPDPDTGVVSPMVSYMLTGLTNGYRYFYYLRAITSTGIRGSISPLESVVPTGSTGPPVFPTGVLATPGDHQITLAWHATEDIYVTMARVYYRIAASPAVHSVIVPNSGFRESATSYTLTGLTNGVTYQVWATFVRGSRNSPYSSARNATPLADTVPNAPTGLRAAPGRARALNTKRYGSHGQSIWMQLRLNRWQQPAELQTSHLWWIEKQVCRLPYGFKPSQVGLI